MRPTRTVISKFIPAVPAAVYRAFLDPDALVAWLPPGSMTGVAHEFEPRVGGAFSLSLHHTDAAAHPPGKSGEGVDCFPGRFMALVLGDRIVRAVAFESHDAAFAGEMTSPPIWPPKVRAPWSP